ncbi:MarR family winged helix-turn-helix transcriptional regulator [Modestobacter roseus]|uniref:DNA-binding MarR family transcriptional regulator n=1 Tax=Modestobacter roseus TaxID=1181884 RepID=A0A562ISX9_9ACTN|nr:MarR family transcriptional regulator [Modestobacter roseus]MQA35106.1 MarR family transcriptional regulator [Modestobacter roseus]TWH73664.1 DNA-binding MarR family transcriptional regulator [Modestobacter roseus]
MSTELSAGELAAYFALRRAGDRLQRAVTGHLRDLGLTEVQFSVLAQLGESPDGIGMSDLAHRLVVTKSGLTYQAGQLESRGLVNRTADLDDDRAVRLRLTADGAELLARALPAHIALVRELFIDRMTPTQLAVLREALTHVAAD